jgi:hypothetical protein
MKGDSYLPGVQALGSSLRATGTVHDFVCMITPDVTKSKVVPHATRVVEVPYLTFKTKHMKTEKQRDMYTEELSLLVHRIYTTTHIVTSVSKVN